jgi:precorrin-2 dehydrogenase / sirohydrochlorin ferrochelatase
VLVDLALNEKVALIIGRGVEVQVRAKQLLAEYAKITVLTDLETGKALRSSGTGRSLSVYPGGLANWRQALRNKRPFLVVVSTGDPGIDEEIAEYARDVAKLVYVVDKPYLNDLNMVGVARHGDIRIAVSTKGLSPAMAGVLRRKIESLIEPEDILQVKLQGDVRSALKKSIADPAKRKKVVYKLIRDREISSMLQSSKYEDARRRALSLIAKYRR